MHFVSRAAAAVLLAAACGLIPARSLAQAQGLRLDRALGPPQGRGGEEIPTFVTADRIEGVGEAELDAVGDAEIRRGEMSLTADRIRYLPEFDEAEATGNVKLRVGLDAIDGPRLRLRIKDEQGIFDEPQFKLGARTVRIQGERQRSASVTTERGALQPQTVVEGRGEAKALRFDAEGRYRVTDGSFTTCRPGQDDWVIEARELDIDMEREVATVRGGRFSFFGVPTPRVPWFDFSLNNQRKSGFLPPTFGTSNNTGAEIALPFYWNIAPNYDATITPRYMSKRGLQLLTQARALQRYAVGDVRYEVLPEDQALPDKPDRWAVSAAGSFNFLNGFYGLVNYNKVSDDNYFRDLSSRLATATQTFLPQQAIAAYAARSGYWSTYVNYQRFQTLQDPTSATPVTPPYFREPQVVFNAQYPALGQLDVGMSAEYVNFQNSALLPAGQRATAYPYLRLPFVASYGYITPKIGVSGTTYDLNRPGQFGANPTPTRVVGIGSVDAGLFFERDASWFGGDYTQTLEPRAYYLYVPYRDQTDIPVFDTSNADLSFSQLFQENIFVGGDRISNANQVTLAAITRLLRPGDGQELVRAAIGQTYFFTEQKVFIPGLPVRQYDLSPIVFSLSGRVAPGWTTDTGIQYQPSGGGTIDKFVGAVRYSPAPASIASLAYRYTNENLTAGAGKLSSVDAAMQWPLGGGFYGVGRLNYDLEGGKVVESLVGLEYSAGCWIIRAVGQQFQTGAGQNTSLLLFQLELNGFARIGSNPVEVLRRSIPGYSLINNAAPGVGMPDLAPIGGDTSRPEPRTSVPFPGTSSSYRYYD
jgi:LPS-assembly protein